MSARVLLAGLLVAAAGSMGCELVAGIKDRQLADDQTPAGGSAQAGGMSGAAGTNAGMSGSSGQGGAAGNAGAAGEGGASGNGGAGLGGNGGGGSSQGGTGGSAGIGGSAGGGAAGMSGGGAGGSTGGASGMGGSTGGSAGNGGSGGAPPACVLTQTTTTGARVANLVPSAAIADFCFKPHGATDFTGIVPVLRGVSSNCPTGYGYEQVSPAFDVAPGIYDVKAIAGTATDCTDPGVATLPSVVVKADARTDVFLIPPSTATGSPPPSLVTFLESTPQQFDSALRVLHFATDVGAIDVGVAMDPELPTTLIQPLVQDVAFNTIPTMAVGVAIDAEGYLQFNVGGATEPFAAALTGQTDASVVRPVTVASGDEQTVFLVGTASDVAYPTDVLVCDEDASDPAAGWKAVCNGGSNSTVSVKFQTFNTQQTGVFVLDGPERLQPTLDALSKDDSDVLCIGELWDEPTKQALVAEAKAMGFMYSVEYQTDITTPTDDPTDANGMVPPDYTTPACSAAASVTKLDALVDCARDKCSTMMGDESAIALPGQCMQTSCASQFLAVLGADKPCYSCALTHLQSYQTMATTRSDCTTVNDARFAYQGNNGQVLLSKLPIKSSGHVLLPSTEWRVTILNATLGISTPNGNTDVDVFCTTLTTPAGTSFTRPYTGQYGGGATAQADQWNAENLLQAQKLEAYVEKTSGNRRAVVLGEFYAGPDYSMGMTQVLTSITPMTFQSLLSAYAPGEVPGYTPACTYCSTNPLVNGTTSYWESHIFLHDIAVTDVTSTIVDFTDPVVPITSGTPPMTTMVPLSMHYGLRSAVSFQP